MLSITTLFSNPIKIELRYVSLCSSERQALLSVLVIILVVVLGTRNNKYFHKVFVFLLIPVTLYDIATFVIYLIYAPCSERS